MMNVIERLCCWSRCSQVTESGEMVVGSRQNFLTRIGITEASGLLDLEHFTGTCVRGRRVANLRAVRNSIKCKWNEVALIKL